MGSFRVVSGTLLFVTFVFFLYVLSIFSFLITAKSVISFFSHVSLFGELLMVRVDFFIFFFEGFFVVLVFYFWVLPVFMGCELPLMPIFLVFFLFFFVVLGVCLFSGAPSELFTPGGLGFPFLGWFNVRFVVLPLLPLVVAEVYKLGFGSCGVQGLSICLFFQCLFFGFTGRYFFVWYLEFIKCHLIEVEGYARCSVICLFVLICWVGFSFGFFGFFYLPSSFKDGFLDDLLPVEDQWFHTSPDCKFTFKTFSGGEKKSVDPRWFICFSCVSATFCVYVILFIVVCLCVFIALI